MHGRAGAVNPAREGTKAAAHYHVTVGPGQSTTLRLRLSETAAGLGPGAFGSGFESVMATRLSEADEFYDLVIPRTLSAEARSVMRQALGGMLWSKQFYYYDVRRWLTGDPTQPPPAPSGVRDVTTSGRISTTPTSSRCPTSGSTRGTPPGISRSTRSR